MWWTFAAASIASLTALIIAFIAYPWQKQKDRDLQVQAEKRVAYREFFETVTKLLGAAGDTTEEEFMKLLNNSRCAFNSLVLYAPVPVIEKCREVILEMIAYDKALRSAVSVDTDEARKAADEKSISFRILDAEAMQLARQDVSAFLGDAELAVKQLYGAKPNDRIEQ